MSTLPRHAGRPEHRKDSDRPRPVDVAATAAAALVTVAAPAALVIRVLAS